MDVQVYRLNASPYQDSTFFKSEKEQIEQINGAKYIKSASEIEMNIPFILISNTHTNVSEIPEEILSKTIAIIHPNSGYDNFNTAFVQNNTFPVLVGNPIRSHAVSEYILGCIFQHFTPIPNQRHWSQSRTWDRKLLRDQKILILGQGMIGSIISQTLTNLVSDIKIYDPYKDQNILKTKKLDTLESNLLQDRDIIIFTQSLNEKNKGSFGKEFFRALNSSTLIINSARGGFIIEQELHDFLKNNPKSYAFLDVFQDEPYTPGYLTNLENLNKTSHIAGVHSNIGRDIIKFECHLIKEIIKYLKENKLEEVQEDFYEISLKSKILNGEFI